ncbi:MAG: tripartite tricarboxylate transporter TctB family protein [Geminicoccaceae bacterium]
MTDERPTSVSEEGEGLAPPVLDLIAAICLVALSVWVMVEAARMEVPGTLATAPGLLPFLTAASLCVMAIGLSWLALRRRAAETAPVLAPPSAPEVRRTLMLFAVLGCYLLGLDVLSFQHAVVIAGARVVLGSFELVSIVVLTILLAMFWGRSLAACAAVAVGWILALSAVFRYVFGLPLPG